MTNNPNPSQLTGSLEYLTMRMKLAALWTSLMFLYIYADVFSLYRPGAISKIIEGYMGPFEATQSALSIAAALMFIPAMMVAGSFVFGLKTTRILQIVTGVLFTLVNVGNLIGETWVYYLMYGAVEIAITIVITIFAWRFLR